MEHQYLPVYSQVFNLWPSLTFPICESIICFKYPISKNHDFIFRACLSKSSAYVQVLLNLKVWQKMMEFFIWSGCEKLQWKYWWQFVLLMCKSVVIEPFSRLARRSKNAILFFDDIYVNWMFGRKLLSPSINLFSSASLCVQIKKSMCRQYISTIQVVEVPVFWENLSQFYRNKCRHMEQRT